MKTIAVLLKAFFLFLALSIPVHGISSAKIPATKNHLYNKPVAHSIKRDPSTSLTSAVERLLNNIEKNILSTAEAMPQDKFYFSPESLAIKGSQFIGVRSFAGQIKHLATDNFAIWSPITGEVMRSDIQDLNGPASIKSKAEIISFLKESFALGHRAIAKLTEKNAMDMIPFRGRTLPRLDLAFYALTHANEHYGQMVVYLRLCGVIPPPTLAEVK
jgi:uncharacterized damage-inducible protein DinB